MWCCDIPAKIYLEGNEEVSDEDFEYDDIGGVNVEEEEERILQGWTRTGQNFDPRGAV